MRLATLRSSKPDGELVIVSRDLARMCRASDIAPTLQAALDEWPRVRPLLNSRYNDLCAGMSRGAEAFNPTMALSPLPRAYQWCDGSVYEAHNNRMSQWIKKPVDPRYYEEPAMYQGASDVFLAPTEDIPAGSEDWGIDFEGEIAVISDAVPYGVKPADAGAHIALVMLCNDVSLRNLIPAELARGFGFVQSKPSSAFSPVAVTPDELTGWSNSRLQGRLRCSLNGVLFGDPDAGSMVHGFDRLVAHAAKTRALSAGSIIGGGTVANADPARGTSCITERRVIEILEHGEARTPYLRYGDRVRIEMLDDFGSSIFGAIEQTVALPSGVIP